jgi:hypothetical protein
MFAYAGATSRPSTCEQARFQHVVGHVFGKRPNQTCSLRALERPLDGRSGDARDAHDIARRCPFVMKAQNPP